MQKEHLNIDIIGYLPEHHRAFKQLNEEWINKHFTIEKTDSNALDHPQEYILDKGGKIIVAIQNGTVLGVCALVKMENSIYDFELAKMAVSQEARGKGIGYLLGKSIIETARSLGAKRIYLESNSVLEAALSLYQKLGFQDITDHQSPYSRCNVQMGLSL